MGHEYDTHEGGMRHWAYDEDFGSRIWGLDRTQHYGETTRSELGVDVDENNLPRSFNARLAQGHDKAGFTFAGLAESGPDCSCCFAMALVCSQVAPSRCTDQ